MENNKLLFLSQVKKHYGALFSGISSGLLLSVLPLFFASKSKNVEALTTVSSEAQTPLTFAILFTFAAFLLTCAFVINRILGKDIYNKFFFYIFNILLGMSISNVVANLFIWDTQNTFFRQIHPCFTFLDVLDFTALPILVLMIHVFVDLFSPRNYSNNPLNEPLSYILYLIFIFLLGTVYLVSSAIFFIILL